MEQLKNIKFSKIFNYNKNDGKFCYVNDDKQNMIVSLPTSKVTFDVDYNYNRPNLIINLTDSNLIEFINVFNKLAIEHVYRNSREIYGFQKSHESLEEFYCNPHKKCLAKKNFTDTLKLKLLNKKINPLMRNTKVDIILHISGLWFSSDSFGPYFDIMDITLIELPFKKKINVYSFINEDSEEEIIV